MTRPVEVSFDRLLQLPPGETIMWVQPAVRAKVTKALPFRVGELSTTAAGTRCLIAIGGGVLLDIAKAWRADRSPGTHLVAVPSVWGSGAEVSPVVVLNVEGRKSIRVGDRFLPDAVAYWPELAESLSEGMAKVACGDAWSHAVEGFLSPLATDDLRRQIAGLMQRMSGARLGNDPIWFRLGAEACAAQSRSSVGLVHGIAHSLEGPLRAAHPDQSWGHARLCSIFLWPVLAFNAQDDGKAARLLSQHAVDTSHVLSVARQLHDASAFAQALPFLRENWRMVLRDPCSRTNVRLVRPSDLSFFDGWRTS